MEVARKHFGASSELEAEDFEDTTGIRYAGTIPADFMVGETRAMPVDEDALRYIRSGLPVQFRLSTEKGTNGDNARDQVSFGSGDNDNILFRPLLEVQYILPESN